MHLLFALLIACTAPKKSEISTGNIEEVDIIQDTSPDEGEISNAEMLGIEQDPLCGCQVNDNACNFKFLECLLFLISLITIINPTISHIFK